LELKEGIRRMGRLVSGAKTIGKNYYFYASLYCIGILGMLIITYSRYDIIDEALNLENWKSVMYLLGTLLSLPVLAYMFLQKITRSLAVLIAGVISIVIMIIYWISTTGAETFVATLRDILSPFLAIFFIYSALLTLIHIWQKVKR
jgi:hypothetical protein